MSEFQLALTHLALFLQTFHLLLGLFQLGLEPRVGMQARYYGRGHQTCRVDITLEMIAAYHTALSHVITAFKYFILALRINLGQDQSRGPPDRCMTRRI